MTYLLTFLMGGIVLGYLLKDFQKLIRKTDSLAQITVYLLLFFLGIQVGKNPQVMSKLTTLGGQSLILSIGAVVGSLVCSWIVYRFFFQKRISNAK